MAKSNIQLLQEAIAKGDLERAAELTAKLAKPKAKPKTPKTKRALAELRQDRAIAHLKDSDYLAPTRNGDDYWGGRTFTDQNGNVHQYARRVSMEGTKFVNKFDPDDYDRMSNSMEKFDKKQQKKHRRTPRPGEPGASRDPVKKIRVTCHWCRNAYDVYPWECEKVDSATRYCCNTCVKTR
jgi:homoserine acetyltransferase